MNIADLPESRKFMEKINAWFYKTKERNPNTNVRDILKNLHVLSNHIQLNPTTESNLCVLFDITNILIQQVCGNGDNSKFSTCTTISQSCTNINEVGQNYLRNEPLLMSASKYKSLDTLAGCFTSVESAGSMSRSRNDDSLKNYSKKENIPISPIEMEPPAVTGRKSLPASAFSSNSGIQANQSDNAKKLERQLTWERETPVLPITSSPIASITDGMGQISLDELDSDAIVKLCISTRSNMDKIESLLKKSLNRTHNLSKSSFLNNSPGTITRKLVSPSPRINRGAVGRFSLGAPRLPVTRRSLGPKVAEVPARAMAKTTQSATGASTVLQSASRNIMTAKRKISSLTSLRDFNSATNSKLKPNSKGNNSVSNIPGLRTASPRTILKKL